MTQNNFTILPFYDSLAEQDSRRWWKYGRKYPLFASADALIPFQFARPAAFEPYPIDDTETNKYINERGHTESFATEVGTKVRYYADLSGVTELRFQDIPPTSGERERSVAFYDGGGVVIDTLSFDIPTTQTITLPAGTKTMAVVTLDPRYSDTEGVVLKGEGVAPVQYVSIRNEAGEQVKLVLNMQFEYKRIGDLDYIIYAGNTGLDLPIGLHYLDVYDGINHYYSDFVTIVARMDDYLKIEWWDEKDFEMDAGTIIYELDNAIFHNIVYLASEIAKPEYTFEEEVERRDGYDFPTKQISSKTYRFSFFATEYMLDVLRLVRMADRIVISNAGRDYLASAFLITPEWEKEGDVAGVAAQFQTDMVAKKIGLAYVRSFNNDFNNDFS